MSPSEIGGGGVAYLPYPPPIPASFHLLEVTIISAQDLFQTSRTMRTYTEAWVHPHNPLRTRLDSAGHADPTWNDKFVFRLDDATLRSDTSAVTFDVYASRGRFLPGRDTLIGTARAVLSSLRLVNTTRFVALQVRRPHSLRPQGILNVGVSLLDAYVRSMPLYAGFGASSALALGDQAAAAAAAAAGGLTSPSLVRRGTVAVGRRIGEREQEVVESKLEKWRAQLSPLKDGEDGEEGSPEGRSGTGRGRVMGKRMRSFGRMACFAEAENARDRRG